MYDDKEIYPQQQNNDDGEIYPNRPAPQSQSFHFQSQPTQQSAMNYKTAPQFQQPTPYQQPYQAQVYQQPYQQPYQQEKTKFCKYCGGKIPEDAVVCTLCGRQVEELRQMGGSAMAQPVIINNSNNNVNTNNNMNFAGVS